MARVILDAQAPIDFVASEPHYFDHLVPVYDELKKRGRQGIFFAVPLIIPRAQARGIPVKPLHAMKEGTNPTVCASYKDLRAAFYQAGRRPLILSEHGCGLMAGAGNPSYAGGRGVRGEVSLFLCPNDYVLKANKKTWPEIPAQVVGCPKLDASIDRAKNKKPVIAVGFHWNCILYPETRNAFSYFENAIRDLAKDFKVIGHAHPRAMEKMAPIFRRMNIEIVQDFNEVLARADVYVNDCSSTMYEAAYYGIPVVVLNAPFYRRDIKMGIRFWDHADVGVQCDHPADLAGAVITAIEDRANVRACRERAVEAVYPIRGNAAEKAADAILKTVAGNPAKRIDSIGGKSVGIVYVAFGEKARSEVMKSLASMRRLGFEYPVTIVGDGPIGAHNFIQWEGQSPFDLTERKGFRFRAGRIKPFIYDLSPYDYTLYIDADTEYLHDISDGFKALAQHDFVIARETLAISQLYNKPRAGWEINIQERDLTIREIDATPETGFLNSGVIFFRKSAEAKKVFCEWHTQWMRFQQWDEQLSLMRAIHKNSANIKEVGVEWNHPHRVEGAIIFHNYGRGVARSNGI